MMRPLTSSGLPSWLLGAFVFAASLTLTGCVTERDPIPWEKWRHTFPPDASLPLAEKAAQLENQLLARHLSPEGVLVYRRSCDEFQADQPGSYRNLADETIWTGALLGCLAFKFKVTAKPEDRELLIRVLRGLELLHDVTGKPGLLARAIAPRGLLVPGESPHQEWRDAPPPRDAYRYRGDVSKDQYAGVLFGYAATALQLGIDHARGDDEIRALLRRPACAIADHIWENGLEIVDVDGETTKHGDLGGYFLCVPIGINAALSLGFQLLAHRLSGESRFTKRYQELLERDYHKATSYMKFQIFGWTNHSNDNMGMMALYALVSLEQDAASRSYYERSLQELWRHTRNEGNAFFHLVYASRFPLPRFARFDLRENLRVYPLDRRTLPVDARELREVERTSSDNRFGVPTNRTALPLHLRRRSAFVWKDCPFALCGKGNASGTTCVSGVDFLLAYWMARCYLHDPETLPDESSDEASWSGFSVPPTSEL